MRFVLLFFFLEYFLIGFGQTNSKLEIPQFGKKDTIVVHTGYSVSYNSIFRQANWVAYQLTAFETIKVVDRKDKFKADPKILKTDNAKDYLKSGYDRGHLAPSADMTFSEITMLESFYFSNISPQNPSFNRGIWNKLEDQTRSWAKLYDSIYIVVGPILEDSLSTIGIHQIPVPKRYYKVILDNHKNREKMIAFIIENKESKLTLQKFVVTVDSVETITGIDFFPLLVDSLETKLESEFHAEYWKWDN